MFEKKKTINISLIYAWYIQVERNIPECTKNITVVRDVFAHCVYSHNKS